MKYHTVLFDLDGTLTDPGLGITNSVMYALERFGIHISDRRELYKFIGPPLLESFERFYGFDSDQAGRALKFYREYFADKGIFENKVYDGIRDMLSALYESGLTLAVATSKPEPFARRIIDHFGLACFFRFVGGSTMDETRVNKDDVIRYVLDNLGISDKKGVLMVGDRMHDVIGAHKCGIDCAAVLYGYGSREELASNGADYIAEAPGDISGIVL